MNTLDPKDKKNANLFVGLACIGLGLLNYWNPPNSRPTGFWGFYSRFFWDVFGSQGLVYGWIALGIAFVIASHRHAGLRPSFDTLHKE